MGGRGQKSVGKRERTTEDRFGPMKISLELRALDEFLHNHPAFERYSRIEALEAEQQKIIDAKKSVEDTTGNGRLEAIEKELEELDRYEQYYEAHRLDTAQAIGKIFTLQQENAKIMAREYSGKRNWSKQLDADVKAVARNNKEIEKLENQLARMERGNYPAGPKARPQVPKTWRRAGEGWYVGDNGYEIRKNYKTGEYDIVRSWGTKTETIKSFGKLSNAKKYQI